MQIKIKLPILESKYKILTLRKQKVYGMCLFSINQSEESFRISSTFFLPFCKNHDFLSRALFEKLNTVKNPEIHQRCEKYAEILYTSLCLNYYNKDLVIWGFTAFISCGGHHFIF